MTTESKQVARQLGLTSLLGAAFCSLLAGLVVAAVAVLVAGGEALTAAAVGTGATVLVFGFGTLTVDVVAAVMPRASLLVALLTYVLQLLLMTVVLLAADRGGLPDDRWLAGAVVAAVLAWTLTQMVLTTRRRIPVYDIPLPVGNGRVSAGRW